jgi:flavin reductase (DIM6/NTAB) family NADH-FMN oxidoreductase RutF
MLKKVSMNKNGFESIEILNNFYQTSSFFPMPVVLISTISESGETNLGPYSLCFPYRIAGKWAMKLNARPDSNTAMNIMRTGLCAINFITDDKKYMENCVMLGFPGETTEEKMANSIFTLIPTLRTNNGDEIKEYPKIVAEAVQVYECSLEKYWIDDGTQEFHAILLIDNIHLKSKWKKAIIDGNGNFPALPVDYGYRNNTHFWFTKHSKPYKLKIPESKAVDINAVRYAVDRCDSDIEWTDEACEKIVKVPRVFMSTVIRGINKQAREAGKTKVTAEFMDEVRDKRNEEKKKR